MKEFFSIISALFVLANLFLYRKEAKNKKNNPNIIALGFWALTAIANCLIYGMIVQDVFKTLFLIAVVFANFIIFFTVIRSKKYLFLPRDIWIIIIVIFSIVFLAVFFDIKDMYIIMQIITTIPYVPLIIGIIQGKGKEPIVPWILNLVASSSALFSVLLEYSDYWSLIYPLRTVIVQIILLICIKKFTFVSQ
jgi:hypothetical protein